MEFHQILAGFSYGEIDPKLQAQVEFLAYNRSVKTAKNVLSIPQGGFTRRFGSEFVDTTNTVNKNDIEIIPFVFDNLAVYCLVFEALTVKIYLENTLQTEVPVVTPYPAEVVQRLTPVQVINNLIILHQNYESQQLIRTGTTPNVILAVDAVNNLIELTTPINLAADTILPITFLEVGTLPTTSPQIFTNTSYYARLINATNIKVYFTPEEAAADIRAFDIIDVGVGANTVNVFNGWSLSTVPFSTFPSYDFGYSETYRATGFTFTAAAVSGTVAVPTTITASAAVFTAEMVGGVFRGNGGVARIISVDSPTVISVYTYEPFIDVTAFPGSDSFLGAPAWSDARGWPKCGTFFQQRLFLGGSRSIPNGVWGSIVASAFDFNDAEELDDDAISFYPNAGSSNVINAMTSSKSLIIHSNTGNYSTPLTSEVPVTPRTFTLTEQNKDGVSAVIPVFIDNQIIYVDRSANNVKSMYWSIEQGSYVNTNISITAANLIETPVDMAVFSEPSFTDGFYLICVNSDGKLAIYNSLLEQEVKGWSRAETNQNETEGSYRRIASGLNRAWVIVERIIDGGTVFYLEELEFNLFVDCGKFYKFDAPQAELTGLEYIEGQSVQIVATPELVEDAPPGSIVYPNQTVVGGAITLPTNVIDAYVGLGFESLIEPLPVNVGMQTGPSLYLSTHIRNIYIQYLESVGMELQGFGIPTQNMQDVVLNQPSMPTNGVFKFCLMEGWQPFEYTVRIVQRFPLPMTLLAIGYDLEI